LTERSRRALDPRIARLRSAAEAGHTGDAPIARAMLPDEDPGVRSAALGALFRAGAVTLADVDSACGDESPAVRRRVAELMAAGPSNLRPPIGRLLDDPDPMVLEAAAWAAGECDPPLPGSVERLARLAIGHDDALVREAAVAALGAIGDDRGLPAILAATTDKPAVRRRAVIALAPFSGPEVDAALERASTDRDWQVRQAAEDLLR
jgi:HEAT repeat protein